eukprot:TRINITY_DN11214_c0_g2_i1.p1 TRINITY_DN11214_c0_g2~~TRINITY_DN11214_c0_g2_i1.p1  ORF type:complete len:210 (+),score=67.52 TRINITY_DN11214_c0_g2_i1:61-630(+)
MCIRDRFESNQKKNWTRSVTSINWIRVIFDNVFFFVLVVIIIEVLSGIIIDTFAVLRKEAEAQEAELKNNCFICGIPKEEFDKSTHHKLGFKTHVFEEHNMWNYIFYVLYVRAKKDTELTGIEIDIRTRVEKGDLTFFPIQRSLMLNENNAQKSFNPKAHIKMLEERLSVCDQSLKRLKHVLKQKEIIE